MRPSIIPLLLLTPLLHSTAAQNLTTTNSASAAIPACAQPCLADAIQALSSTHCGVVDFKCICSDVSFLSKISCCALGLCGTSDQVRTLIFGTQFCVNVGVTLPVIDNLTCASAGTETATAPGATTVFGLATATVRSTTTSTSTPTPPPPPPSSATPKPASSPSPSPSLSRLSTPATAGIAAGASAVGLALLTLAGVAYRRHRARLRPFTPTEMLGDAAAIEMDQEKPAKHGGELGGNSVSELPGSFPRR